MFNQWLYNSYKNNYQTNYRIIKHKGNNLSSGFNTWIFSVHFPV